MTDPILSLDAFLPYRLSIASNMVSDVLASTYEAVFGLSIPEWRLVAVIAEYSGITQQEIGLRTRMDKVTVSRAAIALTQRALLERSANEKDKRSHLLVLSAAGRELYEQIAPRAVAMERKLLDHFQDSEIEMFTRFLRRIEAAAADFENEAHEFE